MAKQETKGGPYVSYAPYNNASTIYQFAWDGATWTHLQKPEGTFISTWGQNEKVNFAQAPNKGVNACLQFSGSTLLGSGIATNSCIDTLAPSAPTNLAAIAVSSSQINLNWTASTDNVGVASYDIFRGGVIVGSSAIASYSDSGLAASTSYSYYVKAKDAAGNVSGNSNTVTATTYGAGTTILVNPTDDSYVYESNALTNYGSDTFMYVKTDVGKNRNAYLKFDISSVSSVSSAKLRIYGNASAATTLTAYQTSDSWSESSLTWTNKPAIGSSSGSIPMNTVNQYYEIDVTSYVQSQASGDKVVSFVLKESAGKYTTINSSENSTNKPELAITQ